MDESLWILQVDCVNVSILQPTKVPILIQGMHLKSKYNLYLGGLKAKGL